MNPSVRDLEWNMMCHKFFILVPLLFSIDLIDLFHECEGSNIASYAD